MGAKVEDYVRLPSLRQCLIGKTGTLAVIHHRRDEAGATATAILRRGRLDPPGIVLGEVFARRLSGCAGTHAQPRPAGEEGPPMIRAFVGLPLGETATEALLAQQAGLPAGRPVPPENFHVTLAFLGEHPRPMIEDVHYALDSVEAPAFAYGFAGLDFLGGDRPRVVHAAIRPEPALKHLRDRVLEAARSTGLNLPRERFVPHVTLARLSHALPPEDLERLRRAVVARASFATGPFRVERFALYRSHLGRSGAVYEEMASYPLRSNASASISTP